MDQRFIKLAHSLINYSVRLQKGEKILLEITDDGIDLAKALVEEVYKVGGVPFLTLKNSSLQRALLMNCTKEQMEEYAEYESKRMKDMVAYISVRASYNSTEMSDVPADKMHLFQKYWSEPVHSKIRVPHTKWCILRYPNGAMSQGAGMSTEAFEDFFFNVCTLDYSKMEKAMTPLVELMNRTDKVHIKGPGTDLHFSIKGIPAIKCAGTMNIPDGEVFTAPVKNSINGTLSYNCPTLYQGIVFDNIKLTFKDGKIVEAVSNKSAEMNKVFDTDEGSRYVGEFALGVNPYVMSPMKDILFDEKISGSFHFTPGCCYDEAPNGNKSAVHWDLVNIQRADWGGGEIYFDDVLVRRDGLFVLPELECLNPDKLK